MANNVLQSDRKDKLNWRSFKQLWMNKGEWIKKIKFIFLGFILVELLKQNIVYMAQS